MTPTGIFAWARLLPVALLAAAILVPSLSHADDPDQPEPPVRLKRKKTDPPAAEQPETKAPDSKKDGDKKKTDDKPGDKKKTDDKPGDKKKTDEKPKLKEKAPPEPAASEDEEAKETIARISKNMRAAEERLKKNDPGDATRGIQRDVLTDLDKLIEESNRQQQQQQQQSSSSSSSSRRKRQQQQQQKAGQKNKPQPDKSQTAKNQEMPGKGQKPKEGKEKQGSEKEGKEGKEGKGGGDSRKEGSKIADLYKDVWGHLPETMRQEMDAYSREQFMEKYKGLLKQYYSTLSEKARSKENE